MSSNSFGVRRKVEIKSDYHYQIEILYRNCYNLNISLPVRDIGFVTVIQLHFEFSPDSEGVTGHTRVQNSLEML